MAYKKVVIVTGGSSGIGQNVATLLADQGYRIAVVASHDISKAQAVVDQIKEEGGEAKAYTADVSDDTAVSSLVSQVISDFDGLDVLVNAAGIFLPTEIGNMSFSDTEKMISVNLYGVINTINAVVPHMKKIGRGHIVNFSSVAGVTGTPGFSVYSATKAAVIMLTKSLAIELAPFDININAIAPGNTKTPMNEDLRNNADYKPVLEAMGDLTPSNRIFSNPAEIAAGVMFLISDNAKSMYGSVLVMDEGVTAGLKM